MPSKNLRNDELEFAPAFGTQQEEIMRFLVIISIVIFASTCLIAQTAIAQSYGDGTTANPYHIASLENLYWIAASNDIVPTPDQATRWSRHYIQTTEIDASPTTNWFEGQGWEPIGHLVGLGDPNDLGFTGSYNGQNNTIDALFINRPSSISVGLWGYTGSIVARSSIENLGVTNVNINGGVRVGGLVGYSVSLTISNCYCTGSVNGTTMVGGLVGGLAYGRVSNSHNAASVSGNDEVGGLVGFTSVYEGNNFISNCFNYGNVIGSSSVGGLVGTQGAPINNCYNTGSVCGSFSIGGLVGFSYSSIADSYSTGMVTGDNNTGGLVGKAYSTIIDCYSTGSVTGSGYDLGGLVGSQGTGSHISKSHCTGNVIGGNFVGGLVGSQSGGPHISESYCTGNVSGIGRVGGLIGFQSSASINNCFSTGNVTGTEYVGGLIGYQVESMINTSYSIGSVSGSQYVGGLVGSREYSTINDSYWNTISSGQVTSAGGDGRTTDEMTYPYATNTYVGWDFTSVWAADIDHTSNSGYPFFIDMPVSISEYISAALMESAVRNYPNPFNPETTISFYLSANTDKLDLMVYNIRGQLVKTLIRSSAYPQGESTIIWNGQDDLGRPVASGVYYCRLTTRHNTKITKMTLIK
jgi:hypothetical protein